MQESRRMQIYIPSTIKKKVVTLLLNYNELEWFNFSLVDIDECTIEVSAFQSEWLLTRVEEIRKSGLDDDDEEDAFLRYKGFLLSTIKDQVYWFRVWMADMDDEKEFDVRELAGWREKDPDWKTLIQEAIDEGKLAADSRFLRERSSMF